MSNKYINLYTGKLTANGVDGTQITDVAPLSVTLDATNSESKVLTCALRCESGYKTVTDTTISFTGDNASKWSICKTADGTFADTLTLSDTIAAKNVLFYVKAASANTEDPANDVTVSVKVSTKVGVA